MYVFIFPISQQQFQNIKISGFEDNRVKRRKVRNTQCKEE